MNSQENKPVPVTYQQEQKKKFWTPTRVLVAGLSLGVLGYGTYLFFDWMNSKKNAGGDDLLADDSDFTLPPATTSTSSGPSPKSAGQNAAPASDFPLKKGSRGAKVAQLQQAMISKYGATILPKYGADGQYGSELEKALTSKGLPTSIDEQQFSILTALDTADTATRLYNAATKKDFPSAIAGLRTMRDTADYKTVNDQFKLKRLNGVSTTLVTGMLNTFTDPAQKQQVQMEFSRIGLKYDGSKWSVPEGIAGLPARQIVATRPTKVWQNARHALNVGVGVVLGREIVSSGGITLFDTVDGFRLYVLTTHVRYM